MSKRIPQRRAPSQGVVRTTRSGANMMTRPVVRPVIVGKPNFK